MIETLTTLARDNFWLSICILFSVGVINDYIYAKYTLAVTDRRAFAAANWSLLFTILCLLLTLSVLEKSVPHIAAYLFGGYFGTYFGTKRAGGSK